MLASTLLLWLACPAPTADTVASKAQYHPTDRPWIGDEAIELPRPIVFEPGEHRIVDEPQREMLDDVSIILKNHPEILQVEVRGAATELEARSEPKLVRLRSQEIQSAISARGISAGRLTRITETVDNPEDAGFRLIIRQGLSRSQVRMRRPLNFFPPTADFGPENDEPLGDALAVLQANPEMKLDIHVTGTPTGPEAVPLDVKQKRAERVAAWLTNRGVDAGRLFPLGVEPDASWKPGEDVRLIIRP